MGLVLVKDEKAVARIEVSGPKSALNELIDRLAQNIAQEAKKLYCDYLCVTFQNFSHRGGNKSEPSATFSLGTLIETGI